MKSPQALTLIVALVFAIAVYFLAGSAFELSNISVAVVAFVCAFVAPLVGKANSVSQEAEANITTLYAVSYTHLTLPTIYSV